MDRSNDHMINSLEKWLEQYEARVIRNLSISKELELLDPDHIAKIVPQKTPIIPPISDYQQDSPLPLEVIL